MVLRWILWNCVSAIQERIAALWTPIYKPPSADPPQLQLTPSEREEQGKNDKEIVPVRVPGRLAPLKNGMTHYMLQGDLDNPNAPVVVMLHGASMFSFCWQRLADMFVASGSYRILMLGTRFYPRNTHQADFYGHGYSHVDPHMTLTCELYVQQVEELLEYLKLMPSRTEIGELELEEQKKQAHQLYMIGHSMGGLIASEFAAKHKDFITKVILFNSAGMPIDMPSLRNLSELYFLPLVFSFLVKTIRTTQVLDPLAHGLGNLLSWWASKAKVTYELLYQDVLGLEMEEEEEEQPERPVQSLALVKRDSSLALALPTRILPGRQRRAFKSVYFLLRAWLHQLEQCNRSHVLLSIVRHLPLLEADHSVTLEKLLDIPTFIIWGEEDGLLPPYLAKKWKKALPHAEVLVLPQTDHACFMQKPGYLFKLMKEFIENDENRKTETNL